MSLVIHSVAREFPVDKMSRSQFPWGLYHDNIANTDISMEPVVLIRVNYD
jgi:hypothetical protein